MRVGPRSGYGSMASLRVLPRQSARRSPLAGSLDVGVDGHGFRPFDEISERMGQKKLIGFREEL
jgi:hypothetical protein